MTSEKLKSTSSFELLKIQIKELKEIKTDIEHLKTELITAKNQYEQRLSEYEIKLKQVYNQSQEIYQEQNEKETNLHNATLEWLDIKSKLATSIMSPKDKVLLNIGGNYFETTINTLTNDKQKTISFFQSLFSKQYQIEKDPKDGSIFIDRDGSLFRYILQYFRTGHLTIDVNDVLLRKDLITEAEFYKIDNLIQLLKTNNNSSKSDEKIFYSNSNILSLPNQEKLNKLYGNQNQQWQLIYRASRDGYTGTLFHQFCDGQSPTMTVIRSQNGFIFGGFTRIPWTSANADKADSSAFIFTLKNPFGIIPTKYPVYEKAIRFAICHHSISGPTFGSLENGGSDIFLHSPFNVFGSRIYFPTTYKDTTGKGSKTFTGDFYFSSDDIEVFIPI